MSFDSGPNELCTDCGRRMVWQRETDYPGSWMCPNCVMRRCDEAEVKVATLTRERDEANALHEGACRQIAAMRPVVELMLRWRDIDATFPGGDLVALTEIADEMRGVADAYRASELRASQGGE